MKNSEILSGQEVPATGDGMKKLVLVVIPTIENAYHNLQDFVGISPPMGLASIAATAEKAGYNVSIIDGDAEQLTLAQTVERVASLEPFAVGSNIMTATMDITRIFFEKLKQLSPVLRLLSAGTMFLPCRSERSLMYVRLISALSVRAMTQLSKFCGCLIVEKTPALLRALLTGKGGNRL
ncbi:MAG: cobalamin B12-binding domain-containing protein [Thermodesulfovibrionales bacterium]|nr:cobalamin B12-binding domain-containing protein [Thermodesulfovibrionales bacterium]